MREGIIHEPRTYGTLEAVEDLRDEFERSPLFDASRVGPFNTWADEQRLVPYVTIAFSVPSGDEEGPRKIADLARAEIVRLRHEAGVRWPDVNKFDLVWRFADYMRMEPMDCKRCGGSLHFRTRVAVLPSPS